MTASYRSIFSTDLFRNEVHVVTGGGSGIGRCTAHELASLGATVLLVGRNSDKLAATANEISAAGGRAIPYAFDIREETLVREAVTRMVSEHKHIHGLVNNAGGQFPAPLASISQKGFDAVVRTNLTGGFLMSREVLTQSMSEHGGSIVNIVADMWRGMPGMGHSGAARAGMVNLTETAAVEWAPAGVRVNAVAPGWIASSGLDHYDSSMAPLLRDLPRSIPLKRFGTESEVSAAIVFLLSKAAAFITGATLRVDGGAPLFSAVWPTPEHDRSQAFDAFPLARTPKVLT